ncbi:MAG: hypothetical protein NC411_10740 [Bacteroides sp.]|nr:hypothetical protein [Bacteroides sp.]
MEIVVMIIMVMVGLSFVLKLTYHNLIGTVVLSAIAALFTWFICDIAVNQSKTQIADWLGQPELMLDTSVLLTVDVMFQVAFCVMMGKRIAGEKLSRVQSVILYATLWIPGLLIFPVLLALLTEIIFSFPGCDFSTVAWTTAGGILILLPSAAWLIRYILPENDLRLEMLFMVNAIIAILGVITTVNGRTAVKGTNSVEWDTLAGFMLIVAVGTVAGLLLNKRNSSKLIAKLK